VSQLFISHSNKDKAITEALATRLRAQGHKSLFIDFDPDAGIPAGSKWLTELYRNLDASEGVIVICSDHSMASKWCFSEIAIARRQGKTIFPIKVASCALPSLLEDYQVIDFTQGEDAGYERLWRGMRQAGIDPYDWVDWIRDRPPYPGLASFMEEDAPIFFGRNAEIARGLETLRQIRIPGDGSLLLLLGASGSGKSSLVRAGLLPRLRRSGEWLVIDPFRPGVTPFEQLADVLVDAFVRQDPDLSPDDLRRSLRGFEAADALRSAMNELRRVSGSRNATLLFTIDQFEELLDPDCGEACSRFLSCWTELLSAPGPGVIVIATLRSDFLASFQRHQALQGLRYPMLALGPLDRHGFREVIEGPAKRAGIELEEGLAEELLDDRGTADALPLLAFVLRELWERGGEDRRLTRAEYRIELHGLEGAIGRAAENALGAAGLSDRQWQALRRAFRQLVRINDDRQLVRQKALWSSLPEESHPLLQRLVDGRLLVSGTATAPAAGPVGGPGGASPKTLEVAHEALFRAWGLLRDWLKSDEDFLLWRRRLRIALEGWTEARMDPESLLTGRRLEEAEKWLAEYSDDLTDGERNFIAESVRQAKRRRRRRLTSIAAAVSTIAVLSLTALYTWIEVTKAENEHLDEMAARQLQRAINARDYQDNPLKAAMYFLRAAESDRQAEGALNARIAARLISGDVRLAQVLDVGSPVQSVDVDPASGVTLTRDADGRVLLWDNGSGRQLGAVETGGTKPAGARFATGGSVLFWGANGHLGFAGGVSAPPSAFHPLHEALDRAGIDAAADRAVTWADDRIYVWALGETAPVRTLVLTGFAEGGAGTSGDRIIGAWISGDGKRVAATARNGASSLWNADTGERITTLPAGGRWFQPRFSPDGRYLLHASAGKLRLISCESGEVAEEADYPPALGDPEGGLFFPDGGRFLVWTSNGAVETWTATPLARTDDPPKEHGGESVHLPVISPDGGRILVRHGFAVSLWGPAPGDHIEITTASIVRGALFDDDGTRVLGWGGDDQVRIWDSGTGQLVAMPLVHMGLRGARFVPNDGGAVTWGADGTVRLWSIGESHPLGSRHVRLAEVRTAGIVRGSSVAVTVADGNVTRWDARWMPVERSRQLFAEEDIDGVVLSSDKSALLGWSADAVTVWNSGTGQVVGQARLPPEDDVRGLKAELTRDGGRALLWGRRFPVRVWRPAAGGSGMIALGQVPERLLQAGFSAGGRWVIGRDQAFRVHRWDAENGRKEGPQEGIEHRLVSGALFHDAAGVLVSWDSDGELWFWEPETGEPLGEPLVFRHPVAGAAFDATGERLLTWTEQGYIQVWDIGTRTQVIGAVSHPGENVHALWSGDGKRFLTAGRETLRVWDAGSGFPLTPLLFKEAGNDGVDFGVHGDQILAWTGDRVRWWNLASGNGASGTLSETDEEVRCGCRLNERGDLEVVPGTEWRALRGARRNR